MLTALMSTSWAASSEEVVSAGATFNAGAELPLPDITEAQLGRLLEGKLVKYREVSDPEDPQRVVGMQIITQERDHVSGRPLGQKMWTMTGRSSGRSRVLRKGVSVGISG